MVFLITLLCPQKIINMSFDANNVLIMLGFSKKPWHSNLKVASEFSLFQYKVLTDL